jgi:hypothetical protein
VIDTLGDELEVIFLEGVQRDTLPLDERRVWHAPVDGREPLQDTDGSVNTVTDRP